MIRKLVKYLSEYITEERFQKFNRYIENRTRYITIVLEDIYQPHNASAILRTCDCFGIQDVHIIENKNKYIINPDVELGSSKWLNLIKYNKNNFNTPEALENLKANGYRIIATTPHKESLELENYNLSEGKTALIFGTELNGLTKYALDNADGYLKIPMFGFTESFNISVSSAIFLYNLTTRLKISSIKWQLNEEDKNRIILSWLRNSIKDASLIEKKYFEMTNNKNTFFD